MLALTILLLLILAALSGGAIALFAGRRYYALWLGYATFFFSTRLFELVFSRSSDLTRNLGGLLFAVLVVVVVVWLRERVIRFIPPVGGFLVSAAIAERLLGIIYPEAGKFLFIGILIAGGIAGFFLFRRLLDFDSSIIVLSALWGASFLSSAIFDFLDIFLISAGGWQGGAFSGFLDMTQLWKTLLWLGLAAIGILVQRRQSYPAIPGTEKLPKAGSAGHSHSANHRNRVIAALVGGVLVLFLLAIVAGSNNRLSKSLQGSLNRLEHSLGVEAASAGDAPWERGANFLRPQIKLQTDDRILVLVPHPDDDILSAAGTIQQAVEMGLPVKVVYLTNGDYNETSFALFRKEINLSTTEAYRLGETRREEALAAQGILGVKPEQIAFLGYPDGGGLEIFEKHWGDSQPYRALLSGQTSVFYTFAQSYNAPFKGESIVKDIQQVVTDFKPTKIFTSHPGDVHPDHQTLPLFLQIALWNLKDQINPDVYHFITHYGRWPQPRGYLPNYPLEPPAQYDVNNRWEILPISEEQRQKKLQALKAHRTQWSSGQPYLESLVRVNELFDVIDETSISAGETVEILPAEAAFNGDALSLLPESQQKTFTEAEVRTVRLDGGEFVFAIELQEPLQGDVKAKIWAMGYRADQPFEQMPKIYMDLSADGYKVYKQDQPLPSDSVTLSGTPAHSEVRVPLSLLGYPDKIMVSGQTSIGDVPLDNIPWVFLSLHKP